MNRAENVSETIPNDTGLLREFDIDFSRWISSAFRCACLIACLNVTINDEKDSNSLHKDMHSVIWRIKTKVVWPCIYVSIVHDNLWNKTIFHNMSEIHEKEGEIVRSILFEIFLIRRKIMHRYFLYSFLLLITLFSFHELLTMLVWSDQVMHSTTKFFTESERFSIQMKQIAIWLRDCECFWFFVEKYRLRHVVNFSWWFLDMEETFTLTIFLMFLSTHRGIYWSVIHQNWFNSWSSLFIWTWNVVIPRQIQARPIAIIATAFRLRSVRGEKGSLEFEIPNYIFTDLPTNTNPKYSSKFRIVSVRRWYLYDGYEPCRSGDHSK
jgi:hypothetical protein